MAKGEVKWFNNAKGWGFIVPEGGGDDIFVHFSSIRVDNSQYKYLIQGEYVEFSLVKSDNESHEYHAVDISGIKNGLLMCQTQKNIPVRIVTNRPRRVYDSNSENRQSNSDMPRTPRRQSVRIENATLDDGFTKVSRGKMRTSASVRA